MYGRGLGDLMDDSRIVNVVALPQCKYPRSLISIWLGLESFGCPRRSSRRLSFDRSGSLDLRRGGSHSFAFSTSILHLEFRLGLGIHSIIVAHFRRLFRGIGRWWHYLIAAYGFQLGVDGRPSIEPSSRGDGIQSGRGRNCVACWPSA